MKTITIQIKTKHFKTASRYSSNDTCPLAMAIKDQLNPSDFCVGSLTVDIDGEDFNIDHKWSDMPRVFATPRLKDLSVDSLIRLAKEGKRFPTIEVVLTKI